jgi:predicted nucleic acid-binding protein
MIAVRFVDTNILLYFASTAVEDAPKSRIARSLMEEDDLVLSVQVIQEFYTQATRPSRQDPLTHEDAMLLIESWSRFPIREIDFEIVLAALSTRHRYRISYWDAAIIEAARAAGCDVVLSEDLNRGQDYGGVRVMNPFPSVTKS